MIRTFELIIPSMPNFISYKVPAGKKDEGFKLNMNQISIIEFSEEEATQFGEEMKQAFINHWKEKTKQNGNQQEIK